MDANAVLKKMQVKQGMRFLVLNSPEPFIQDLKSSSTEIYLEVEPSGKYPALLLFADSQEKLAQQTPMVLASLEYDGLLWAAYPKRSSGIKSDLYRDAGWGSFETAGLRPVTQISIDDTWSALRFRPVERVGK